MEITVKTTNKRLTKSLINQMPEIGVTQVDMDEVEPLGYVTLDFGHTNMTGLFHYQGEYYKLNMLWKKGSREIYYTKKGRRGTYVKHVGKDLIDLWYGKYSTLVEAAKACGHIYA